MQEERYYILKKNGKEYRYRTKAAVYEMWDALGRGEVVVEHHIEQTDVYGNVKKYVHTSKSIKRRKLKSGEIRYYLHYE